MNRNTEQRFELAPTTSMERSKFYISHTHKTTFNAGLLIPFFCHLDGLPGETYKFETSTFVRLATPISPTMDNAYIDTYYFAIPHRIIWENWKKFNGENENGAWTQETEYLVPMIKVKPEKTVKVNTIADYFGIPKGVGNIAFQKLGLNAYIKTWNEWFRDQNLTAPIQIDKSDADIYYDDTTTLGCGKLLPVYKYHDYFTSALPQPQKGQAIRLPLGTTAPVTMGATNNTTFTGNPLKWTTATGTNPGLGTAHIPGIGTSTDTYFSAGNPGAGNTFAVPSNLQVDLTQATAATINAMRLAFATQRIIEKDARGGTRYTEINKTHFGTESPDARQQRPEYLGGKRIPLNMQQVEQTSSTDTTSPLGATGAYSITTDVNGDFTKSFTEHTIILGLACVRTMHTYQQGLARQWTRRRRLDYYNPSLAHLGEQPIYKYEIMANGTNTDNEVFGYKEAWAEYKYKPNIITGELNSTYPQSLDYWHYGDDFDTQPILSTEFLIETEKNIDRTIEVQSRLQNQFIADFNIEIDLVSPMPFYSIPGLLDHY